jgi:hypothetical protein
VSPDTVVTITYNCVHSGVWQVLVTFASPALCPLLSSQTLLWHKTQGSALRIGTTPHAADVAWEGVGRPGWTDPAQLPMFTEHVDYLVLYLEIQQPYMQAGFELLSVLNIDSSPQDKASPLWTIGGSTASPMRINASVPLNISFRCAFSGDVLINVTINMLPNAPTQFAFRKHCGARVRHSLCCA